MRCGVQNKGIGKSDGMHLLAETVLDGHLFAESFSKLAIEQGLSELEMSVAVGFLHTQFLYNKKYCNESYKEILAIEKVMFEANWETKNPK